MSDDKWDYYYEGYDVGYDKGVDVTLKRVEELEAKLAKAREEGFWAGRSCGGAKKEIDAALAELKGQ